MDDGRYMDRRTAVQTLYPRFLYIFSDVVCYVTRNPKAWADSALRLLEWSMAGAESTINQHALPALIIVLNGPTIEDEEWIHGSPEAVTDAFFKTIEEEISANEKIKNFANFVSVPSRPSPNPSSHLSSSLFIFRVVPPAMARKLMHELIIRLLASSTAPKI